MGSRRNFIKSAGLHSAAMAMLPFFPVDWKAEQRISVPYIPEHGDDEDFWSRIQESYTSSKSLINLNNGGVSPQPKFVQEAFELNNAVSNEAPSYQMWRILEPGRLNIRKDLADLLGCTAEEVVINRNTTEALDTVIFGLDLKKGDEIVLTHYDYPNMRNAWEQRKKRDGIVLKYVDIVLPDDSEEKIVERYAEAVTSRTKLVHITHMVNYNGQVLPAKEITEVVKKKSSEVLVMLDGAHTFAHLPFNLKEIQCDFFGTSLHKWLCSPFGTGMMYIKKDKIEKIWPFFPTDAVEDNDIRKFEAMGTRSVPAEIAVGQAILFHKNIGIERKYKRLKQLTDYWTKSFLENPKFISYNPMYENKYASLFTFGIEGMSGGEIANYLQKNYRIITSPIKWENIDGCRVSPHVYTSFSDLDKLIQGIQELINK
jgi:selenocysteine lyase/cysteine desulfurase